MDKGIEMISNGLKEPFLEIIGKRLGVGGYFNAKDIEITDPNNVGIVFWPCYNPGGTNGYPRFFLVGEQVQKFDSINDPLRNNLPGSKFIMPMGVAKYTETNTDQNTVKANVLLKKNISTGAMPLIDATTLLEFVRNFEVLMMDFSPDANESLCRYGQYFFRNNSDYQNFLKAPDLNYVYYYMGFAWDASHKPNYYRPILSGIRADGSTIETNSRARGGEPLLQKSVPPPPHQ